MDLHPPNAFKQCSVYWFILRCPVQAIFLDTPDRCDLGWHFHFGHIYPQLARLVSAGATKQNPAILYRNCDGFKHTHDSRMAGKFIAFPAISMTIATHPIDSSLPVLLFAGYLLL